MNDQEKNKAIADKVLDQIESKHVKMKPKYYFVAGSVMIGLGMGAAMLVALYAIGLGTFQLRSRAPFDFLSLGAGGVRPFADNFPWLPALVAIAGIWLGIILIKKYRIGYRHSLLGVTIGLIGVLIVTGVGLQLAGAHRLAEKLPVVKGFYTEHFEGDSWLTGSVLEIDGDMVVVVTPYNEEARLLLRDSTHIQPSRIIEVGEWLRAIGEWDEVTFQADHVLHGSGERFRPKVKGDIQRRPLPTYSK